MIPINGNLLTETLVSSLGILILGLLIIRVFPIKLKSFQAVYLMLGAANLGVHYFFIGNVSILWPIGSLIAGIILLFLATGKFGKLKTSAHYETLLVGVGLFPWYLGWIESIVYVIASVAIIVFIHFDKQRRASKKYYIKKEDFGKVEEILKPKDLPKFNKIINEIYTTPVGLAGVISIVIYSLVL